MIRSQKYMKWHSVKSNIQGQLVTDHLIKVVISNIKPDSNYFFVYIDDHGGS